MDELFSPSGSMVCTVCQDVANKIKAAVDPSQLDDIKSQLDAFCDQLAGDQRAQCQDTVNMVFTQVEQLLKQDARHICMSLHLCEASPVRFNPSGNFSINTFVMNEMSTLVAPFTSFQRRVAGPAECSVCKTVVADLLEVLKNPQVVPQVEKAVLNVCKMIVKNDPTKARNCQEITMAYVKQAIKLITEQKPDDICAIAGQCTMSEELKATCNPCQICKDVVSKAKQVALNPSVIDHIRQAAEVICEHHTMNPEDVDKCRAQAKQCIDKTIEEISQLSEQQVCEKMHAC